MAIFTGWWFQPLWKIIVKLGIFPNFRGENKKYLKPPPSLHVPNHHFGYPSMLDFRDVPFQKNPPKNLRRKSNQIQRAKSKPPESLWTLNLRLLAGLLVGLFHQKRENFQQESGKQKLPICHMFNFEAKKTHFLMIL